MTPAQRDLRDFIVDYQNANGGVTPSYDEMRVHLGLASRSNIHRMLGALESEGVIARSHGAIRNIRVIGPNLFDTFASLGKQVLAEGCHFADAADDDAARLIALALNQYTPLHSRNALARAA